MSAAVKSELYCYDLRGKDTETNLVGPITSQIIDADRLVRTDFRNGMPNWMLYRTALAGDSIYLPKLRHWVIAFAWVVAVNGGVKRRAITDEFIGAAAMDVLSMLLFNQPLAEYSVIAKRLEMSKDTYKRFRDKLYRRLSASLNEYWIRLILAYGEVKKYERIEQKRNRPYN